MQQSCSHRVITVRVADDHVLDVFWIETELGQSVDDFVFYRIVEQRVDDDDAGRCVDGPCGVLGLPQVIQVVEHLHRLGVPFGPLGRRSRGCRPCPRGLRGGAFLGRHIQAVEHPHVFGSRRRFGGCDVRIDSVRNGLREKTGDDEAQGDACSDGGPHVRPPKMHYLAAVSSKISLTLLCSASAPFPLNAVWPATAWMRLPRAVKTTPWRAVGIDGSRYHSFAAGSKTTKSRNTASMCASRSSPPAT